MPGSHWKILVVEDDAAMREVLRVRLEAWGYHVSLAEDGVQGSERAESDDPDLVLSDVVMPGLSGLDLLRRLKQGDPRRAVVLMTAQGSIDAAVEAMKQGALDYVTKPLDYDKLKAVLDRATGEIALRRQARKLDAHIERGAGYGPLIGTSKPMRALYALLEQLASRDVPALLTGESGTGKELAARIIHEGSARARRPFVAVNAAAMPEGLVESELFGHEKGAFTGALGVRAGCFELAHGGTLFLDEIAEMPMPLQPKLLRVLENGKVRRLGGREELSFDVRLIAATNQDPREAVEKGRLREDLYYRLNVFTVHLPALRERKEDLAALAQHFIRQSNEKHRAAVLGVRPQVLEKLQAYPWPGNVRELRNVIERAVILAKGDWIELSHLPPYVQDPARQPEARIVLPSGATAADSEKELILKTLQRTGHNKAETARQLGLDVKTIRNKLKSYGKGAAGEE